MLLIFTILYWTVNLRIATRVLYPHLDRLSQAVLSLALSVLGLLVISSVLGAAGCFEARYFVLFFGAYSVFGWFLSKRPSGVIAPSVPKAALLIVGLTLVTYLPPSRVVIGGSDPFAYVAAAFQLADHGSPAIPSRVHSLFAPEETTRLFGGHEEDGHKIFWYGGVYFVNDGSNTYRFDFARGPSYLLAFALLLAPRDYAFYANLLYPFLAIFSFYLLTREVLGPGWGLAATLLFLLSPSIIWFGRATYTEPPSLFLILFAILHLLWAEQSLSPPTPEASGRTRSMPAFLFVACLAAAGAMLMRIDQILLPWAVLGSIPLFFATQETDKRMLVLVQGVLVALLIGVVIENHITGVRYFDRVTRGFFALREWLPMTLAVWGASVPFYSPRWRNKCIELWESAKPVLFSETAGAVFGVALVLLLFWGLAWRPTDEPFEHLPKTDLYYPDARLMDEHIFIRLALMVGLPQLLLGYWGMFTAVRQERFAKALGIFAGLACVYSATLLRHQMAGGFLYWGTRRYLPVIVPALILFGTYALSRLQLVRGTTARRVLYGSCLLISVVPMINVGKAIYWHSEVSGALALVNEIEERFDRKSTVFLSDSKNDSTTIRFIAGYEVLPIPGLDQFPAGRRKEIHAVVERLQSNGWQVVLISRKCPDIPVFEAFPGETPGFIDAPYAALKVSVFQWPSLIEHKNLGMYVKVLEPDLTSSSRNKATNLALRGVAAQSSTFLDKQAKTAINGNRNGDDTTDSVSHTNRDPQAWWEVDLGAPARINEVRLWNRTDCCQSRLSNYYVLVSEQPIPIDLAGALRDPTVFRFPDSGPVGRCKSVIVAQTGRYVRVQLQGTDYLSLAEVEVLGNSPGTVQTRAAPSPNSDDQF